MNDDDLDAAWHQAEQEERRQREETLLMRCRQLMDELKQMIDETTRTERWT
jgi:hypothetical protein